MDQYLKKDQDDHVCGIEEKVHHRTRFHSGAQFGSSHLTLLEHIAVCLGTLPSILVSSQAIYTYNMWYDIYHGDRMAYIGKKWLRIQHFRKQRVLGEARKYVKIHDTSTYRSKILYLQCRNLYHRINTRFLQVQQSSNITNILLDSRDVRKILLVNDIDGEHIF